MSASVVLGLAGLNNKNAELQLRYIKKSLTSIILKMLINFKKIYVTLFLSLAHYV